MKKIILLIAILAFAFEVNAQKLNESDVPQPVKTNFAALYPDKTAYKWEMENGKYEASFKDIGVETSVLFKADGTHIQTEVEIAVSSLPAPVNKYVKNHFKSKKINEAAKISAADGTVTYEAEIGNTDYFFDANGNYLGSESEGSDTDDK